MTVKGKGLCPGGKRPKPNGMRPPFFLIKITGEIYKKRYETPQPPKYQDVFRADADRAGGKEPEDPGHHPCYAQRVSLKFMMEKMPDRAFDVGICEQHAVTLSAGMATQGMRVSAISTLPSCKELMTR